MKYPHNISRIEAFSDAVFAFAATLLVVNVDIGVDIEAMDKASITSFLSFFVSFFVLVGLWWVHYNFFRRTDYMDNWIIALNVVLLFVVLYYVFPLKSLVKSWMGEGISTWSSLASLFLMYGLGFLLIFLCFALMYFRAYKKTKATENSTNLYFYFRHFLIFSFVGLISVILAYMELGIQYGLPGFAYVLIGPFCTIHSFTFFKKFDVK